jgi:hypothetical protein
MYEDDSNLGEAGKGRQPKKISPGVHFLFPFRINILRFKKFWQNSFMCVGLLNLQERTRITVRSVKMTLNLQMNYIAQLDTEK